MLGISKLNISTAKICIALIAACSLSACMTGTPSRLDIVPAVEGAATSSVLVYSTRARSDEPGVVFSGERGQMPSGAIVEISIPPTHKMGKLEISGREATPDPEKHFAALSVEYLEENIAEQRAESWFEQQNQDGGVLIYVHGYNIPFDIAVFSLAQLRHDAGLKSAPMLFAWPSSGQIGAYLYDRESANYSRDVLEQAIRDVASHPEVKDITIFAHSMGGWLTMEALRQYAIRDGAVDDKVTNVVLASPDVDVDVFVRQLHALGEDRPYVTILSTQDDAALRVTRFLAGGVRLGAIDATTPQIYSALDDLGGIAVLDLTEIEGGDFLRHSVFSSSPQIVAQLGAGLLNSDAFLREQYSPESVIVDVGSILTQPIPKPEPVTLPANAKSEGEMGEDEETQNNAPPRED